MGVKAEHGATATVLHLLKAPYVGDFIKHTNKQTNKRLIQFLLVHMLLIVLFLVCTFIHTSTPHQRYRIVGCLVLM